MKYDHRIGILKAIGIILVVWGHATKVFHDYVYSFHMPLFFWISGYLRFGKKDKPWNEFLEKKTKTILIPYLIFWIISMVVFRNMISIMDHHSLASITINHLKGLFLGGGYLAKYSNNFPLWFLQFFFVSNIIFEYIIRNFDKRKKIILFIVLVLITIPIQALMPERPVLHINILPAALIFMMIGYYTNYALTNKNKHLLELANNTLFNLFFIILGFAISIKYPGNISEVKSILYLIGATLTITALYNLVKLVKNYKILDYIGERTLYILGLHLLTIKLCIRMSKFIVKSIDIHNAFITAVLAVTMSLIICCSLTDIYKMIRLYIERKYLENENN